MRQAWIGAALGLATTGAALGLATTGAAYAQAQHYGFDGSLSYAARHTVGADGEDSDNDIARATLGYAWPTVDGAIRTALEAGVRNEDFSGDYPGVYGLELAFARRVGVNRYAIGARVRTAEDRATSGELLYGIERFGSRIDLRGNVGLQGLSDTDDVPGRSQSSAYGLGEAGLWVTDEWVARAGVSADVDGALWSIGTEYRPRGWRISLFLDWGHSFDDYRGYNGYNDLTGGIRWVPRGETLKAYSRASLARIFSRVVEVQ